jgi:O-methyltransferase
MNVDYGSLTAEDLLRCRSYATCALSTEQGVQQTFLLAQELIVNGIKGCFAECGVAGGAQITAMSWACTKHRDLRTIHLFDSFQGIPLAGPNDQDQPGIGSFVADQNLPLSERLKSSGVSICSADLVRQWLKSCGFADLPHVFHEGWFQTTLPKVDLGPIAFLRLDGDLYESTQCCLTYLYKDVVLGGVVLLDDYPLPGSRKAFEEYFEQRNQPLPGVVQNVNTGAAYWVKA